MEGILAVDTNVAVHLMVDMLKADKADTAQLQKMYQEELAKMRNETLKTLAALQAPTAASGREATS